MGYSVRSFMDLKYIRNFVLLSRNVQCYNELNKVFNHSKRIKEASQKCRRHKVYSNDSTILRLVLELVVIDFMNR